MIKGTHWEEAQVPFLMEDLSQGQTNHHTDLIDLSQQQAMTGWEAEADLKTREEKPHNSLL